MGEDLIRYDVLAQEALRSVVRKVLYEVTQTGLPGEHHFFITFDTNHPGVRLSSRLKGQYPQDMTVVLQHQFWDLSVSDTAFEVGLSFNGVPERLLVPFRAVTAFVDPHASFGLKFDVGGTAAGEVIPIEDGEADNVDMVDGAELQEIEAADGDAGEDERAAGNDDAAAAHPSGADVVSLDAFRKKNG